MIDAFAWGILIVPLAAQLAIAGAFYLWLRRKLLASELSVSDACLYFCAVMVVIPWAVSGVAGGLGLYIYTHYAALRPASWDVSLIWTVVLVLGVSYLVSLVGALTVCVKLSAVKTTAR